MLDLVLSWIVVLSRAYACLAMSGMVLRWYAMSSHVSYWTLLLWLILSYTVRGGHVFLR
jgi:hypothetical protein